ncbi:MAG: c-type cytochrome, partial [Nitrospinales bacterium]
AHGSHHETDQTLGLNEPILKGDYMQAQCRNCHDEVLELDGAPELSKGKKLFLKLGCHGCHLAEGFENEEKVGPRLLRIASKVNPSWLFRWVKEPKQYLPKTRMPNFGLSDDDALAIVAYLLASSESDYKLAEKFNGGDPENGEKLFSSRGCLACHELKGRGEVFGPDLTRIASKVNKDWLVSWLSNPKKYNDRSRMPNLRLSLEEASDVAAYLLQFSEPEAIPGIEERIRSPQLVEQGKVVVRRRGCFACHDIKGMEKEGRIAPELSAFGVKQTWELEFGDSHIPHTWESWAGTKLKKPDSFRTERVLDKMPNFDLAPDEINALLVLLRGFNGQHIPEGYRRPLSEKEKTLETGRRLILKYNCRGCHVIEGKGGRIQKYIKGKNFYPPPLDRGAYHVGERIKASWLFSFLKNPTPVRTWLKVRMPTFFFTDKDVREITAYFEALAPEENKYEPGINIKKHIKNIESGVKMVNYMDCGKCHDDGAKGIDFSIASERLRQTWIPKWLKNTRELIPETRMPSHWEKEGDKYLIRGKFELLNEVEGGDIDKQVSDIRDLIVSYNTVEFDPDLTLPGAGEDEDEEGDEEDEDEEEYEEE